MMVPYTTDSSYSFIHMLLFAYPPGFFFTRKNLCLMTGPSFHGMGQNIPTLFSKAWKSQSSPTDGLWNADPRFKDEILQDNLVFQILLENEWLWHHWTPILPQQQWAESREATSSPGLSKSLPVFPAASQLHSFTAFVWHSFLPTFLPSFFFFL